MHLTSPHSMHVTVTNVLQQENRYDQLHYDERVRFERAKRMEWISLWHYDLSGNSAASSFARKRFWSENFMRGWRNCRAYRHLQASQTVNDRPFLSPVLSTVFIHSRHLSVSLYLHIYTGVARIILAFSGDHKTIKGLAKCMAIEAVYKCDECQHFLPPPLLHNLSYKENHSSTGITWMDDAFPSKVVRKI